MAPKHHLPTKGPLAKRLKKDSPNSTSPEATFSFNFELRYPKMSIPPNQLTKDEKEEVKHALYNSSPLSVKWGDKRPKFTEGKGECEKSELDCYYTVTPAKEWDSMKKYNNFIIAGEVYKNNQYVFVRNHDTPAKFNGEEKVHDFWVGRILEVRAVNQQHVYALLQWFYWPEELLSSNKEKKQKKKDPEQLNARSGHMRYHGERELLASSWVEVCDVLTLAGKAHIEFWDEEGGKDCPGSGLYWRQSYRKVDGQVAGELSPVKKYCVCEGHYNPDIEMVICDVPKCAFQMHEECIIDDIIVRTLANKNSPITSFDSNKSTTITTPSKGGRGRRKPITVKLIFSECDKSTSVYTEGVELPTAIVPQIGVNIQAEVTDNRVKGKEVVWTERVECLKCRSLLD